MFQEGFDLVAKEGSQIEIVQWVILILGVSEVLLAKANNIFLYPIGIAATVLSVFVLFKAQLFAESLLNVYYIVMSVYGWWFWIKKKNKPVVKITYANHRDWMITCMIGVVGWL